MQLLDKQSLDGLINRILQTVCQSPYSLSLTLWSKNMDHELFDTKYLRKHMFVC